MSLQCHSCGRFFKPQGHAMWRMVFSGYPPSPDREIFICDACVQKFGPFEAQPGIKPDASCGYLKTLEEGQCQTTAATIAKSPDQYQ